MSDAVCGWAMLRRGLVIVWICSSLVAAPAVVCGQQPDPPAAASQQQSPSSPTESPAATNPAAESPAATIPAAAEQDEPTSDPPRDNLPPDADAATDTAATSGDPAAAASVRLPTVLPNGQTLRPIAFFESQMAELIPDHYRPVSLQRLGEAITRLTDRATDDQASRLKGAVYWVQLVDDALVSDRSVIDLQSDRDALIRRSLGPVNLAIDLPSTRSTTAALAALPRLESEPDGDLVAVFQGGQSVRTLIEFKWRLRGATLGTGHEFRLRLPRTPQTRIVLSVPDDVTVEALDGVLRTRPGPPPDAGQTATENDLRWYEIDAGGLANVRLRTSKIEPAQAADAMIVRRSSIQYELDASGLNWTSRMVVQLPPDRPLPPLALLTAATISSVKVNAAEMPFTSKSLVPGYQQIDTSLPAGAINAQSVSATITLTGQASWDDRDGWCELPTPRWIGDGIVQASAVDEAQLAVVQPLQVVVWDLPAGWHETAEQPMDGGVRLYGAEGPPVTLTDPALLAQTPGRGWSRVRLVQRPATRASDTSLRLEVMAGALTAKTRITMAMDPTRIEPLQLNLQPGWTLESVSFAHSGRVVESPAVNESTRSLMLWPESEDLQRSEGNAPPRLVIEATGSRALASAPTGLTVPPTWFLRGDAARGGFVAAIDPPSELNWSGEAAMQTGRIKPSDLNESQRSFLQGLGPETLYFASPLGRTPEVMLETPSVSFDVATVLQISREGDEVVESLQVEVQSAGQSLRQLSIQTGPPGGRPPYLWSLSGEAGAPSTSLPPSDISLSAQDEGGIYTIDVSEQNIRSGQLIARRRYPIPDRIELQLPSVPGAASQRSELLVGAGLVVSEKSRGVQRIPNLPADQRAAIADAAQQTPPARLRYDAVEQPTVVLDRSDVNANVTIVWWEKIQVIASSRGTDRIEATYKVTPNAPLLIDYDPELQLASVSRDGTAVGFSSTALRPIELPAGNDVETLRIVWNRSQYGSGWMRQCRIPRVTISGTVLKSQYQLVASPDTFAPAALLHTSVSDQPINTVVMLPGEQATLMRRNIALACGWLLALTTFVVMWILAERAPLLVAAGIAVLSTIVVLWWPWKLAVIGWLIVPSIAAALLATARAWTDPGRGDADSSRVEGSGSRAESKPGSTDLSWPSVAPAVLWIVVLSVAWVAVAHAQDAREQDSRTPDTGGQVVSPPNAPATDSNASTGGSPSAALNPVNVLVPVDRNGQAAGEIVYIPRSVQSLLFQPEQSTEPQQPRFQSASYRVRLAPISSESAGPGDVPTIEAEYLVHVDDPDRSTNLVHLPIAAAAVRRVELIADVNRIIAFKADASGQMIATLPKGDAFRLRLTLLPMTSQLDQWNRLFLSVPPVAAARLTVESERNIEAIRVGGTGGRLLTETDLRRWVEDLGPVDALEIDYRSPVSGNAATGKPMQRRYWINASHHQVTIDCEVDPPATVTVGETFQFVIRDSEMPKVTSLNWRLVGSELYSPTRRLITFTSLTDAPGPIRLLWTRPTDIQRSVPDVPQSINVPEVIAAALGENMPAWIALHCDPTLRFAPVIGETTEPLSVDHFVAQWSGYRGRIDRAFVALDEIPPLQLQRSSTTAPMVTQRHHLHVMPDQLQVEYDAALVPGQMRHALSVPGNLELVQLSIDGKTIDSQAVRVGATNEYLLGSFGGPESVSIRALAIQPLESNRRFSPPRLVIAPAVPTAETYTMSRDRGTVLREIKPVLIESATAQPSADALSLARGWIPVATWTMESNQGQNPPPFPSGLFEVRARKTRFDCQQLIALVREDSRWRMETRVRFDSPTVPDFVDVEIPTRWCESLDVKPTTSWSRQPSIDPNLQIVRIRCDVAELRQQPLTISGRLQSSDAGRIGVPTVRILGLGKRQVHISVPDRLTNEQIQWRTSAVEAVELPQVWSDAVPNASQRSTYLVANRSWSIDLAPLPELSTDAVAVLQDNQVFARHDGVLVIAHWDLSPGGLETIDVALPPGSVCLGAWTAGKVVLTETVQPADGEQTAGDGDASESGNQVVRVPLALSRMSQPVEVLIHVPSTSARRGDYLPELIGVPVMQNWLAQYEPTGDGRSSGGALEQSEQRALALARGVVESVEQAVDVIAERPSEEVAAWLQPWMARYANIATAAGHVVDLDPAVDEPEQSDSPDSTDDSSAPEGSTSANGSTPPAAAESPADPVNRLSLPSHLQWKELDARMAVYVDRFLPTDFSVGQPIFGVANFEGFAPQQITRLTAIDRPAAILPLSTSDRGLRSMLVNALTLLLVCGLLVCLKPLRRYVVPLAAHPAFWLGLLGIFGFAVAPTPVAAAMLLVAIAMPAFPSRRTPAVR